MKISIIIPVYNADRYLRECLDSVLAQDYHDWEAVCVDDGSNDHSGIILDEYARSDVRIRVIHQNNAGAWAARNKALDIVCGDWITFVDADDVIDSSWLSAAASLANNGSYDLIRLATKNDLKWGFEPCSKCGREAAEWGWRTLSTYGYLWLCFIRQERIGGQRFRALDYKEDGVFLMELIPRMRSICQDEFRGYHYRTFCGSLSKQRRTISQCVAYLDAYLKIWGAQKCWAHENQLTDIVKSRLRSGADHDVWEWFRFHVKEPRSFRDIRSSYLKLEKSGALAACWCHPLRRLWCPWLIWRYSGSFIGYKILCLLLDVCGRLRKV